MKKMASLLAIFGIFSGLYAEEEQAPLQEVAILPPIPAPPIVPPYKSPFAAAALSVIPGLGHAYLGDMKTASSLAGGVGLSYGLSHLRGDANLLGMTVAQNTWFYGIYAAYRDARLYNKGISYSYPMPTDSFADVALAPFRMSVLKKPEVWGGFLGAFAAAATVAYFAYPKEAVILSVKERDLSPLVAFPVGIGEEAFFRGYLQSQLAEITTPWTGIALSSLAFGAVHIPNAIYLEPEQRWRYYSFSLPLITAMGAYCGWMTYKNRSLKESVALHAWYDFTILGLAFLAHQTAAVRIPTLVTLDAPF